MRILMIGAAMMAAAGQQPASDRAALTPGTVSIEMVDEQHRQSALDATFAQAVGDALTQDLAKFQVDAMLLQATDFSIYLTYVASGTTPGYTFGKRSYHCAPGSVMGWECRGSATLCKL